ncbi:MAG: hypothetical protein JSU01_16795 [Bacteroidetes bacterium]|nr:hypothetical protein [Bacteroidota bacterium]
MKKLFYLVPVLTLFIFSCKKDTRQPINPPSGGLYLKIVKGSNQTDTIGNQLKDSIVIKATNNGSALTGYTVQFKRSGCQDLVTSEATVNATGQASYAWYLSGETGAQSLKVILLDNTGAKIDSVSVAATGLAPAGGWHRGGCLQNFPVNNVTALSSGRILASVNRTAYPYYSDDNAKSWHPLTAFGNTHFVNKILSTAAGIFVATQNDGIFLSADNGQSWSSTANGIWSVNFSDMAYTASGNLIVTNSNGLFISTDKGQSWNENDFGLPMGPATYPVELPNGNLFVIGSDNSVYMLPLHTSTWQNIGANGNYILSNVESLFVDNKGNLFAGTPHDAPDGTAYIYESIDGGTSWSPVFTQSLISTLTSYPNIDNISQVKGVYYFSYAGIGVYQTSNFTSFSQVTSQLGNIGLPTYTIGQNSVFVLGSPGFGVYYRIP